ncbi:GH92 family glycosyl hydrolase [Alteromonas sp. ALT199]|uniref:GH92 family glycosyl hydrolase n=1 Tax=unclassified Alteromonas TaxID=2614992 RepID=UPI001BE9743D|nr:GH92 family glycosyl hydrolase [Alteromonas sp. ALT199]MBT3136185.1 GH92 family glycosyl hydrolase [Alteromonas sp. ALT199]
MKQFVFLGLLCLTLSHAVRAENNAQYVDPFIGTSNFGATHPGAQYPNGLVSVSPFNVAHRFNNENPFEKDEAWNSRVYIHENTYFTGLSHLNLSGVGCPEAGVVIVMPTTGTKNFDAKEYGSSLSSQFAKPGVYSAKADRYGVEMTSTASVRSAITEFAFPAGQANVIINLGQGLTNETGGSIQQISETEFVGSRTLGTFCYSSQDVRPVYFAVSFDTLPTDSGVYKKMPKYKNVEADWIGTNDDYKSYAQYRHPMYGDDLGGWATFTSDTKHTVKVKVALSFTSIENARENLHHEIPDFNNKKVTQAAETAWNNRLNRVQVEGETDDKIRFYTALYHTLIHPSIISDVNGDYPLMGQSGTGNDKENPRFSVFSLWDTSRNVHPLLSLLYPHLQQQMMHSAIQMAKESGWLPKWELFGMETQVMVGDPGTVMIADAYLRGITDVDITAAFDAMLKSALQENANLLRPEINDYLTLGYVPFDDEGPYDGSVATSLEYFQADYAIAKLATALNKDAIASTFYTRAAQFEQLFDPATKMLRPKNRKGEWLSPFDPELGRNFEPATGYIEGNAWNYRFYTPHAIPRLIELHGGKDNFEKALDATFATNNFDMANEPDITYPFLYNYLNSGVEKTTSVVHSLINEHFGIQPGGLPGNDDTGTMSAWLAFSMMGIYPLSPADANYTIFAPVFDKITLELGEEHDSNTTLIIEKKLSDRTSILFNESHLASPFISHSELVQGGKLTVEHPSKHTH